MKKIIFIHLLNDYSGSPKVLSQVIKVAQKNNYEVELLTGQGSAGFLSDLTKNNRNFFYKRVNNKYITLLNYLFSQFSLFFKILSYRNEEVIIYINTLLPFGAGIAAKMIKKPVIYHIHETSINPKLLKKYLRAVVSLTADKVIFVSKFLQENESFSQKREFIIGNALSENFRRQANLKDYMWKNNRNFCVLMICSLKIYKGILEFLMIASQSPKNINFFLVLNASRLEIDNFFAKYNVSENVQIFDRQTDLSTFYLQADLVLNLSRTNEWIETFGLTIIEAMAYGIPVIVPPVGGPVEIVCHGIEGYCISSYETNSISQKIKELSENELLCNELSRNAKKRSKDFSEENFGSRILNALDEN